MQPSNGDAFYILRLYWDNSLVMRAVIYGALGYAVWTALIVICEAARETFKRNLPKYLSHQLVACWAATFFWVAAMLLTARVLEPLPLHSALP